MARRPRKNSDPGGRSGGEGPASPVGTPVVPPGIPADPPPLFPVLPSLSRIMSVVMLMFGILAVGALFYRVMAVFFVPLFLAALLVVIFRPVHDWLYWRLHGRGRIAAAATTLLILMVVFIPVMVVLSVAATQFTALVSQVNLNNVSEALERGRRHFSLSLPHADHFRTLEDIIDSLDNTSDPEETVRKLEQAQALVVFLEEHVQGSGESEEAARIAENHLSQLASDLRAAAETPPSGPPLLAELDASQRFEQRLIVTTASVRAWMHTLLGGPVRSQLRLIANPEEEDFIRLLGGAREALQPRFIAMTSATGGALIQGIIGLVVAVIAIYFFLVDGAVMIRTLMRLSPLDDNYERQLLLQFDRTSRAVVLASVLSALAQGVLAAIAFYLLEFGSVVLLFLLTALLALVPFLGAAAVWVPCALYLGVVDQRWTAAIMLAVYGTLVISSIDNVIKVFVLHGRSQLHPLFALLSVLGGVTVFGPIGIVVGPMVVVFLQTLLEILNHELAASDEPSPEPAQPVPEETAPPPDEAGPATAPATE